MSARRTRLAAFSKDAMRPILVLLALVALLVTNLVLSAQPQDSIPAGTILPVQLNSTLRASKARPGQQISARVTQDVPLPGGKKVRSGATVIGHVVSDTPAGFGTNAEISLRFDMLRVGRQQIPITTNMRAMASMMEVSEAQVPMTGPDHGTSEYIWTTEQIGGEIDHRGYAITHGSEIVGRAVGDGVLVRPRSNPGTACRSAVDGNDQPQAMWLFSSDACGLYGFPNIILTHAGRTDPIGQITVQSKKHDLLIRAGSGILLRVN